MNLVVALVLLAAGATDHPKELVGRWQMEASPADSFELKSDGTATFNRDNTSWSARTGKLTVGGDTMEYAVQGKRLLLSMGGAQLAWVRAGTRPAPVPQSAQADPPRAQPQSAQPGSPAPRARRNAAQPAADPRLQQLLLSSPWCSFHYSQAGGTTHQSRVIFRPDGTVTRNGQSELYSSGSGGQYYSGSKGSEATRYEVRGQRLFVDMQDGMGLRDVELTVTLNSNGYPILHSLGEEYSQCR